MQVRVLESSPGRIRLEADAEEHVLAPAVATNLWVEETAEERPAEDGFERLSALALGERATVVGISARCRGVERRRMLDLGLVPGTVVEAELRSPGGDPTGYRVRGGVIALRREQADRIHVQRSGVEAAS
jgi:DtxR family Mn-dependent transcriptional regulator